MHYELCIAHCLQGGESLDYNTEGITIHPPVGNILAKFRIKQDEENISNFFRVAIRRNGQIVSSIIMSVFFAFFGLTSMYNFFIGHNQGELIYGVVILILGGFILNAQFSMPNSYAVTMLRTTPIMKYQVDLSIYEGGIFVEYFTGVFRYSWEDVYSVILSKYGLTILFGQGNGYLISNENLSTINKNQMSDFLKNRLEGRYIVK
jgi:hypothetical protein